jgi:hypothetical protein
MRRTLTRSNAVLLATVVVAGLLAISQPVSAMTTYGSLSNFDVFNDTGQLTHGFEIELDGVSNSDVAWTFGAERYGDPRIVEFPGGVTVRYESPYDPNTGTFTQTTQQGPPNATPSDGHSCWNGASGGNYDSSGCEHFGVSLNATPTNTVYRWLVEDPARPGVLVPAGSTTDIPAPTWSVSQPAGGPPVVGAMIPAPAPQAYDFGDALWVKVYKTESPHPAELNHLLTDDPAVPQDPAQIETEWFLLQAERGHANPGAKLANEAQMVAGDVSVTRRYEIFAFAGTYDPQSHEARPLNDTIPDAADLGAYLGAQMAAVNVAAGGPPPPTPLALEPSALPSGETGLAYSDRLASGGVTPYTIAVSSGALPPGLAANPDGTLTGTPTTDGSFSFTVTVTDAASQSRSGTFQTTIAPPVAVATQSLPTGIAGSPYSATLSATGGYAPYGWSLVTGSLPAGLSLDGATGRIAGVPSNHLTSASLTFQVTDALGATASKTLSLWVL